MLEDAIFVADEASAPVKATGMDPETGATLSLGSHPREQQETLECLGAPPDTALPAAPHSPIQLLDPPTSPDEARPPHASPGVVCEGDQGAAPVADLPVADFPSTTSPPPPQQSEASTPLCEQDEWEVRRIVGKRRTEMGYEYKVRWRDTWLPKSELGNARRLLREFEAQDRAQRGSKPRKSTRARKAQ